MSSHALAALVLLAVMAGLATLALPVIVATARDVEGKGHVILLALALGWTGVGWVCALILALSLPRRSRSVPETVPTLAPPHQPMRLGEAYCEGVYLVSTGLDSHTWAVHTAGEWRIVYEVAGTERLVGAVAEADVPLGVLAEALRPSES